ncbi:uncharacterized protein LACBIDRAFT_328801 [Laccaria bicolor S238N-H82]|uniref:Predicted protein n=1 Tax=Laccaria bicolor (strain S238N-H82 / ATCC MYA-4686) TaxID=486041 RepID=B0DG12_LACBS|nr:uncharacterized protein LACBIDRAFT_328801 [Laccaria bicolor S238N-H82]EDR06560.1 predicted protein [Laccaria bicolor S238N-H82]|eukprot:XP_001882932.1 predicted protein [Laccaria bicolor S238N-H82]
MTLRVSRVGSRPLDAAHYIADSQIPCNAGPWNRPGCHDERRTWLQLVNFQKSNGARFQLLYIRLRFNLGSAHHGYTPRHSYLDVYRPSGVDQLRASSEAKASSHETIIVYPHRPRADSHAAPVVLHLKYPNRADSSPYGSIVDGLQTNLRMILAALDRTSTVTAFAPRSGKPAIVPPGEKNCFKFTSARAPIFVSHAGSYRDSDK